MIRYLHIDYDRDTDSYIVRIQHADRSASTSAHPDFLKALTAGAILAGVHKKADEPIDLEWFNSLRMRK